MNAQNLVEINKNQNLCKILYKNLELNRQLKIEKLLKKHEKMPQNSLKRPKYKIFPKGPRNLYTTKNLVHENMIKNHQNILENFKKSFVLSPKGRSVFQNFVPNFKSWEHEKIVEKSRKTVSNSF